MSNLPDNSVMIGKVGPRKKSKLSIFTENKWSFVDPNSLNWESLDRFLDYFPVRAKMGVLEETATLPSQTVEIAFPGEYILRDTLYNTFTVVKDLRLPL